MFQALGWVWEGTRREKLQEAYTLVEETQYIHKTAVDGEI